MVGKSPAAPRERLRSPALGLLYVLALHHLSSVHALLGPLAAQHTLRGVPHIHVGGGEGVPLGPAVMRMRSTRRKRMRSMRMRSMRMREREEEEDEEEEKEAFYSPFRV